MSELSTMKNISQARAKFAWDCASGKDKEYGSLVGKIPSYVKTNGLLNTLAFLYSDRKNKQGNLTKKGEVLKNIREWLTINEFGLISISPNSDEQMLYYLTHTATAKDLIQCTTEVLALFNWLRRFAKSE